MIRQFIITSRDSKGLDDNYPNAYWRTNIPSIQNVTNMNLSYCRIDGQILNLNEHSNFFWVRYPDLPANDQWHMITLSVGMFEEAKDLGPLINNALEDQRPIGSTLEYGFAWDEDVNRFKFVEPNTGVADREVTFEDSNLGAMIGFPGDLYQFGSAQSVVSNETADVWANFKEIYLLCSNGHNINFDIMWPDAANPVNVIAVLPLEWRTKNDQTTQFVYTNYDLQYLTPPQFETADSLDHLVFQLIYRDRYGFHLVPQHGYSGNTLIVNFTQNN